MRLGRAYFAVQALAGAGWWVSVAFSPIIRELTLGSLDPVLVAIADIPLFVIASALASLGIRAAAWVSTVWTILVALGLAGYATVTTEAGWGVLVMAAAAGGSVAALSLVVLGRIPTEWIVAGPFAFRAARARSGHGSRTAAQLVVFWGFFLLVVPAILSSLERRWGLSIAVPWPVHAAGIIVLLAASTLGIWTAWTMSTRGQGTPLPSDMARTLVVSGPYRYLRNPMAVAGIAQGVAVGLIAGSWFVVGYALSGSLLWNYAVRPWEEADLAQRFGEEYAQYRERVRCWIPRLSS